MSSKNTTTSWGNVAAWYDDLLEQKEGTYQKEIILPNLLRLMRIQKKQTVLDLACGQGFFARAFADAGAQVTGSDISSELIALARKHSSTDISYHSAPASDISFAADASFDAVSIVLALQNIENIDLVFKECARVLRKGGSCFMVINHPVFRVPKLSSWGWDDTRKVQYRRMDAYASESRSKIEMHPGMDKQQVTVSFHRPLQLYFKLLRKHGFCVSHLEEWVSHKKTKQGPRAAAENRARKEFPLFLFLQARK